MNYCEQLNFVILNILTNCITENIENIVFMFPSRLLCISIFLSHGFFVRSPNIFLLTSSPYPFAFLDLFILILQIQLQYYMHNYSSFK